MINKLTIKNFQSHNNSKLEFGPGVNVICGSSGHGKSAIIRALNLIINNKPGGTSFITENEKECKIILESEDNKIERVKSEKENYYKLNNEKLTAFGVDTPEEVTKVLNFNDLNFQFQHDSSFLISESPGQIAKTLNRVINLEIIDNSLAGAEKLRRQYKKEVDENKELLKQYKDDIDSYNWIDNFKIQIDTLKSKNDTVNSKINDIEKLKNTIERLSNYKDEINEYSKTLKYKKNVDKLNEKVNVLNFKINDINKLENDINKLNNYENDISGYSKVLFHKKTILKLNEKLNNLNSKILKVNNFKVLINKLNNESIIDIDNKIQTLKKEYEKIKPNTCPFGECILKK